jgi:unsaturated rhamnogalacturonyl hydrolase
MSKDLIETIADRADTYPYRIWGFGEGPALLALLRAGGLLDREDLVDRVARRIGPSLRRAAGPTDHLVAVEVLHKLAELRPELDTGPAVERFRRAILDASRPFAGRPAVHRADHPELGRTVWVDCLHTDVPGLVLAGHPRAAVRIAEEVGAALQDESGLFSHGYDVSIGRANNVHWGRGQGWALYGLAAAPPDPSLETRLANLLRALADHEADGRWHTIIDDPTSPAEHSVSALVASGVLLASRARPALKAWLPMARRALSAAVAALDSDGGLPVSGATPVGDRRSYLDQPTGVFPWGQGPLLLALLEGMEPS